MYGNTSRMWPFTKRRTDDDLATLTRRIDDMESAFRRLEVEWMDTLDRLKRLAGRVSKRAEREADDDDATTGRLPTIAQLRLAGRDPFHRR